MQPRSAHNHPHPNPDPAATPQKNWSAGVGIRSPVNLEQLFGGDLTVETTNSAIRA